MELTPLRYQADGLTMTGWLADGSSGRRVPGVLVAHEAPGIGPLVGDNIKRKTMELAERGYVAFALDMYGRDIPFAEMLAEHEILMTTDGAIKRRARAALDTLAAHPFVDPQHLTAIGYCQGGVTVLELARDRAPILAAVGFHPGLKRPAGSTDGPITAKVLMMVGDDDPVVPVEDRQAFADEMKACGADWQLHVFGGVAHTYTHPDADRLGPGFGYSKTADERSWAMMLGLLDEVNQ